MLLGLYITSHTSHTYTHTIASVKNICVKMFQPYETKNYHNFMYNMTSLCAVQLVQAGISVFVHFDITHFALFQMIVG